MSRVVKFIVLAVIGFGLGAGVAWLQNRGETTPAQEVSAPAVETSEAIIPDAPPAPTQEEVMQPVVNAAPATTTAPQDLPVAGSTVGGAFTLTDFNGQTVTEKSWPGQYKMVFFGFSYCPDICPAAIEKMSAALTALGADATKVQPLFITIDPARDTPEKLKEFFTKKNGIKNTSF
jgi:hypothetical protein